MRRATWLTGSLIAFAILSLFSPVGVASAAGPVPGRLLPNPDLGQLDLRADTLDVVDQISPQTLTLQCDGHPVRIPYYCNRTFGPVQADVTRAIVVLHGTLRNASEYQAAVEEAGDLAGGADAVTLILTPQFLTEPDVDRFHLSSDYAYWAYMGWRKGDRSINTLQNPRPAVLSSFSVLDTILVRMVATLPNLQHLVLAGHSAGGQVANLYTATSEVHHYVEEVAGVPVRAIVSNPSSYIYFAPERWTGDLSYSFSVPDPEVIADCPDYDAYKYGLQSPNPYAAIGADSLRAHYRSREAVYLLGGADTNPFDYYLDTTCPAELQGSQRLERGTVYAQHLSAIFGDEIWQRHAFAVVPGVGHDHELMFTSTCGLFYLFDYGSCLPPPEAAWSDVTPALLQGMNNFASAWADYDGDGDDDLCLPATDEEDLLVANDGGLFTDRTPPALIDPGRGMSAQWGDYDNDGRPDLYVVNWQAENRLLHNDGAGEFSDASAGVVALDGNSVDAAWADYDLDGDLDLYVTRTQGQGCRLFRNDGGSFADATTTALQLGGTCRGVAWGDYDGDGDPDLFVVRDAADRLLRNDGGVFVEATPAAMEDNNNGYSAAWGDYDNDADLDLYVVNRSSENRLYRNDGGTFTRIPSSPVNISGPGHGGGWADYDNDGWLDLYVCNDGSPNRLFHNEGGTFADSSRAPLALVGASYGASWADWDRDGDLDLYVGLSSGPNHLFRNAAAAANHWLQITLLGTTSNASAIGARVRVLAGGLWQFRAVGGDAGYMAQNPATLAFGLGEATQVDSIVVAWPSGIVQRTGGLPVDWRMTWIESNQPMGSDPPAPLRVVWAAPNPFPESTCLHWSGAGEGGSGSFAVRTIWILDAAGRRVRTLLPDPGPAFAGVRWDGRDDEGRAVPAGVYFVRMVEAGPGPGPGRGVAAGAGTRVVRLR